MSLWNQYNAFSPEMFELADHFPARVGDPFPLAPDNIHEFFHGSVTKGWFSWEREGYPYWSVLRHAQTWFNYYHLSNSLLVHFNYLLRDLDREMRRIANYLDTVFPLD